MRILTATAIAATLGLAACSQSPAEPPLGGSWTLDGDASNMAFVTVKAGQVAEAHKFTGLSGSVSETGEAQLVVDLASVDTAIDVRNERMREMLFNVAEFPSATVTATLDPATFANLKTGETLTQPVTAALDLHGASSEITTDLSVSRMGANAVRVSTLAPIIVAADAFGLGEGVEALREVANLDAITGQVPVTFSLTFVQQ